MFPLISLALLLSVSFAAEFEIPVPTVSRCHRVLQAMPAWRSRSIVETAIDLEKLTRAEAEVRARPAPTALGESATTSTSARLAAFSERLEHEPSILLESFLAELAAIFPAPDFDLISELRSLGTIRLRWDRKKDLGFFSVANKWAFSRGTTFSLPTAFPRTAAEVRSWYFGFLQLVYEARIYRTVTATRPTLNPLRGAFASFWPFKFIPRLNQQISKLERQYYDYAKLHFMDLLSERVPENNPVQGILSATAETLANVIPPFGPVFILDPFTGFGLSQEASRRLNEGQHATWYTRSAALWFGDHVKRTTTIVFTWAVLSVAWHGYRAMETIDAAHSDRSYYSFMAEYVEKTWNSYLRSPDNLDRDYRMNIVRKAENELKRLEAERQQLADNGATNEELRIIDVDIERQRLTIMENNP